MLRIISLGDKRSNVHSVIHVCTILFYSFSWAMHCSPWSSKNLIDQNQLKKFMRVGVDVKCMHINFGGHGFFGFGDIATFKNGKISPSDHSPWS